MIIEMALLGEKEARFELIGLAIAPNHMVGAWRRIDKSLSAMFARQFDTQGQYRSGGWQELKPSTIAAKTRAGMSDPARILYGTGKGRNSLARPTDENHIFDPDDDGVTIGSKVPYLIFHHSKKEPRTRLPRRPLLALTRPDQLRFAKIIQADIAERALRRR
jgi:phage gpG-like protein